MGLNIDNLISKVPMQTISGNNTVDSATEYVETSINVSDNAYAIKADDDALEPVISKGCTLIVEPNAEITDKGFVVIENGGKQSIYFVKNNEAREYIVTSSLVDSQFSKLMDDSAIKGVVVQIKREPAC